MKKLMLLLLSAAVLMLSACTAPQSKPDSSAVSNPQISPTASAQTQTPTQDKVYLFLNNTFLGVYDAGEWLSVSDRSDDSGDAADILLRDVLAQKYTYYDNGQKTMQADAFLRYASDNDFDLGGLQTEGAEEHLKPYGTQYVQDGEEVDGCLVYPLPLELDDWFDTVLVPPYNFYLDFGTGDEFPYFSYDGELEVSRRRVALNAEFDPFPRAVQTIEATGEAEAVLTELFQENKMENTKPHFTECYQGDLDNDGKEEQLFFANHRHDESMWPLLEGIDGETEGLGAYSVVLYRDDDGVFQTVYSDFQPFEGSFTGRMDLSIDHCINLNPGVIVDVNNDGVYEFSCEFGQWEGGSTCLFALDEDGAFQTALRANWGN